MLHPPLPKFTDTHCHIHDREFFPDGAEDVYERALEQGVHRLICVGTDVESSKQAVAFAGQHEGAFATVGIHPHDASGGLEQVAELKTFPGKTDNIVAVGEIGLDFFYNNSPKSEQIDMLHAQLELAQTLHLPVSFHVREAFDDFWPIFDQYKALRGVLHSFTDNMSNMEQALSRGLSIGVNGIATFSGDVTEVVQRIPLESIILETDAPFLTPKPHRGTMNEPAFVTHVARYVAELRSISPQELSHITEKNVQKLFF